MAIDKRFWIDGQACADGYIVATYLIESPLDPEHAVECIAKEQSLSRGAGDDAKENDLLDEYAAKGVHSSIEDVEVATAPSMDSFVFEPARTYNRFKAKVAYPIVNF